MFSILNRAMSWAVTSFWNKFCLKKRSRLIKALDNRFYVKFMQLEIGLFKISIFLSEYLFMSFAFSYPDHLRQVSRLRTFEFIKKGLISMYIVFSLT